MRHPGSWCSDLSKYMEAYDEDPSKISPDTPVIIIYPESDYYKNFFHRILG